MSGTPNKEGVAKVIALISKESTLIERAADLNNSIRRATNELERVQRELAEITNARIAEMTAMDLTQAGNDGYQDRMGLFLAEYARQTAGSIPRR